MNEKIKNLIKSSFEETIEKTFHKNDKSKKHFNDDGNVLEPDEINFSTEFSKIFEGNSKEEEFLTISEFKYRFLKENDSIDQKIEEEEDKEIKDAIKKFEKDKKRMYFDSLSFNNNESIVFEFKKNPPGVIKKNSFIDLIRIIYLMKYEKINYGVIGTFPSDRNKINKNIILEKNIEIDSNIFQNFKDIAKYSLSIIKNSKENRILILKSKLNKNLDYSSKDDISKKILETDLILEQIKKYAEDAINSNKNLLDSVKKNKFFIFIEKFYPENKNSSYKEQLAPGVINSIINKIKIEDLMKIFNSINNNNNNNNNIFKKEFFNQDIFEGHYIPEIFQTELNSNQNEIFTQVLDKIKKNTEHINNIFRKNLKHKKDDENIDDTIYYFNNRTSIIISSWNTILNNKIVIKGKKYKYIDLEKSWYKDETEEEKKIKLFKLGFKSIIVVGLYACFLDQVGSNFIKKYEEIKDKNKKINELIKKWNKINNKKNNVDNIDILDFDDVEIFLDRVIESIFSENE